MHPYLSYVFYNVVVLYFCETAYDGRGCVCNKHTGERQDLKSTPTSMIVWVSSHAPHPLAHTMICLHCTAVARRARGLVRGVSHSAVVSTSICRRTCIGRCCGLPNLGYLRRTLCKHTVSNLGYPRRTYRSIGGGGGDGTCDQGLCLKLYRRVGALRLHMYCKLAV